MAGPRAEKVAVVEEVRGHLDQADAAILTEYRGLKVGDLATLRRALRAAGTEYKIYKNTLVRRATAESPHAAMDAFLEGPTAIAFVETDVAAAAKVLRDFARTHPALVIKGSYVGQGVLDARTTNALADLPSRETLLAQIAGALAAPMRQFAGLLKAMPQNLAYGISALIDQRVAGGEALPPSAGDVDTGAASGGETATGDDTSAASNTDEAAAPDATAADSAGTEAAATETAAEEVAADEGAEAEASTTDDATEVAAEAGDEGAPTDQGSADEAAAETDPEPTE